MSINHLLTTLSLVGVLALSSACTEEESGTAGTTAGAKRSATKPAPKAGAGAGAKPAAKATDGGAWVGITHQPADDDAAKEAGLEKTTGVVVTDVASGGPGANAGVRSGDVIVAANGKRMKDSVALIEYLKTVKPGDTVKVTLWRDGDEKVLPVISAKRP